MIDILIVLGSLVGIIFISLLIASKIFKLDLRHAWNHSKILRSDLKNIDKQENKGEITNKEALKKKLNRLEDEKK